MILKKLTTLIVYTSSIAISQAAISVTAFEGGSRTSSSLPASYNFVDITADANNSVDSVGFTSNIAISTGGTGFAQTTTNSINGTYTLNNFVTAPEQIVTTFGIAVSDMFDGSNSKAFTVSASTNLSNTLVFSMTEAVNGAALGFGQTGSDSNGNATRNDYTWTTALNAGTATTTVAPDVVAVGHNLVNYVEFSATGGEYITSLSFTYNNAGSENGHYQALDITTTAVPEPSNVILASFGLICFFFLRNKR